jgi:hypothetical protein
MKHTEEEIENEIASYNYLYYLVGLFSGLFVGLILEKGFIWLPIMGLVGILFAAFFLAVFVKGHGDKA